MGGQNSTLNDPWRSVNWREREILLQTLQKLQVNYDVDHLRILLIGPSGAGKSSFITSVNTALQGRSTHLTSSIIDGSVTTSQYSVYKLNKGTDGSFYPFEFFDTMGLKPGSGGEETNNIIRILNSQMQEKDRVNPSSDERRSCNNDLILNQKFHCLVFVLPADIITEINEIKQILKNAHGIPVVVIMTKVDVACPLVKENLTMIYKSKKIRDSMEKCSVDLGIPLKYIFPVKNYHVEINNNKEIDVLLLMALTNIANFANDLAIASEKPWRPINWSERQLMIQTLRTFQSNQNVEHLRILCVGPVGSGKSSFITSVNSALQGRSTYLAHSLSGGTSVTCKYNVYKLNKDTDKSFYPFVFGDTMGLEEGSYGVRTNDIISVLKGHIHEGYTFNPREDLNAESNDYNTTPGLNDKVHCLVFVLPADNIDQISQGMIDKINLILNGARGLKIPLVVVMSRVDEACPLTKKNLKMIYKSKRISKSMEKCSVDLGIPMNYIFPVKNYHKEINNNNEIDILLLMALTSIVNFANDFVKTKV